MKCPIKKEFSGLFSKFQPQICYNYEAYAKHTANKGKKQTADKGGFYNKLNADYIWFFYERMMYESIYAGKCNAVAREE
ncbi:MAG: hypothetical protein A2626_02950 [Candidatus Nealsonbacteria bacterium RIFCSPHIGHO2_01_FULL_38_55]|uniref:Uncharacterized protein n=2 Tax=Candidatus Nealsoniibacteriota TaxID=1817911 RepID=A0A1G2EM17_9BACT|nr:MAG: hypothetical protein A2626_02950 [Candidatus Nealsonbacteria bacterium RIFCSPHIGHO2_01_FULL_38_55]OGZ20732.1 MAG: hypothetical protein A2W55_00005 [Candidatus Nealsonbacteria bacterium RIFCSPHIGHO2_02_38_10]OGZ20955.1 MAG: hypothetical protein A3C48_00445 [Candidatus Nealsonbacteria bacterium RIFCSPHIGHO2_02_FULL_38_75]OGZ23151.1 MAG: hypothetical protein A3E18_02555 [Candidatus Nealsonbacteria bacterium RIFCSPHIGHO2_12_FULL_38_18]OGZ23740.1 MAG: hypothetical protein A2981_00815 [Candid